MEAVPAISAEAVPAIAAVLDPTPTSFPAPTDNLVLEDIHPQGSSHATGGILHGHAAATYYSPADEEDTMFNNINGIRRILQHPGEHQPWQGSARSAIQHPHDEDAPESVR